MMRVKFNLVIAGDRVTLSQDPELREKEYKLLVHGREIMEEFKLREKASGVVAQEFEPEFDYDCRSDSIQDTPQLGLDGHPFYP